MVTHTFTPSRSRWVSEFESRLVYRTSTTTAKAAERNPFWQSQNKQVINFSRVRVQRDEMTVKGALGHIMPIPRTASVPSSVKATLSLQNSLNFYHKKLKNKNSYTKINQTPYLYITVNFLQRQNIHSEAVKLHTRFYISLQNICMYLSTTKKWQN